MGACSCRVAARLRSLDTGCKIHHYCQQSVGSHCVHLLTTLVPENATKQARPLTFQISYASENAITVHALFVYGRIALPGVFFAFGCEA